MVFDVPSLVVTAVVVVVVVVLVVEVVVLVPSSQSVTVLWRFLMRN